MDLVIWRIGLQETTGLTGRATDIYGGSDEELVLFRWPSGHRVLCHLKVILY
jgi:hypothetical protein